MVIGRKRVRKCSYVVSVVARGLRPGGCPTPGSVTGSLLLLLIMMARVMHDVISASAVTPVRGRPRARATSLSTNLHCYYVAELLSIETPRMPACYRLYPAGQAGRQPDNRPDFYVPLVKRKKGPFGVRVRNMFIVIPRGGKCSGGFLAEYFAPA